MQVSPFSKGSDMSRFPALLALALISVGLPASAQTRLELKYPEGTKAVVESDSKVHQILNLAGMDIETNANTFLIASKTFGKRAEDGTLAIEEKVDVLQTQVDLPGGTTLQFDSANPDKKADNPLLEPLMERLRVTAKHPVTTILDDKGKVKEIKLPQGVLESLDESNKAMFDPVKRKKLAEHFMEFIPDEPVKVGDTWERSSEFDLGSGQTMSLRTKYTYAGTEETDGKKLDKITTTVFDPNLMIDQTNKTVQLSKSELKVTESEGAILFDRELGNVQQRASKVRIEGSLTLVIAGKEFDSKLDLTIQEKTKRRK
jgi:hypothetical protein